MLQRYDLELLSYCRDAGCDRTELHPPHGRAAATITARKRPAPVVDVDDADDEDDVYELGPTYLVCRECGLDRPLLASWCTYCGGTQTDATVDRVNLGVNMDLVETTFNFVGLYVPKSFSELHRSVVDEYGSITERGVQRALRVLVDDRRVASLSSAWMAPHTLRNPRVRPPGWYLRYDSPKLWSPSGFRNLMEVVADRSTENSDLKLDRVACG